MTWSQRIAMRSLPAKRNRENNTEPLLEQFHITKILFRWDIPLPVTLDLRIRGEAAHAATHDLAHPGERTRRKRPASTVSEIEDPEASAVEVDRVNIDLIPEIVLKNEMSRSSTRLEAIANG